MSQPSAHAVRDQPTLLADLGGCGADRLTAMILTLELGQPFTWQDPNIRLQWEFITRVDHNKPKGFDIGHVRELFTVMERENVC